MIHTDLKYKGKISLDYQYKIFKNEGREDKIGLFWVWLPVGGGWHKERVNEGEYGSF
jgi:hypothetical protein